MTMKEELERAEYYVTANGSTSKVLEIYESFNGWYWIITERVSKDERFGLVRGLATEWGYIYMPELKEQIKRHFVWKVPRKNWIGVPYVSRKK